MHDLSSMDTEPAPMQPDPHRLRLASPMNTTPRPTTMAALLAAAVLLVACATATPGDSDAPTASPTSPSPTDEPPGDGSTGRLDQQMIDEVIRQAVEDTGVDEGEITVVSAAPVTWSDGSIGCPEEGMGYTQALVSGFQVILDVAGEQIHYHAGSDGEFFPCDDPQEPIEDGTTDR